VAAMGTGARTGVAGLVAGVVIASSIAGCGGKSDEATNASLGLGASSTASKQSERATDTMPEPTTYSIPGFIAKADAICRGLNTKLAGEKAKSSSAKEYVRVITRNVVLEREGFSELEKLAPPVTLLRDWRLMQSYRHRLLGELEALLAEAKAGRLKEAKPLLDSKRQLHKQLHETGVGSGFKDCAEVGAAGGP
jgi:hypothetical protein